jgi:hypothetical protein
LVAVNISWKGDGYTPGDTWELYVGKDNHVEHFVYHCGEAKMPSLLHVTWASHKKTRRQVVCCFCHGSGVVIRPVCEKCTST